MEPNNKELRHVHSRWVSAGLAFSLFINVIIIGCMVYGGHNFMSVSSDLRDQIVSIQQKYDQVL